MKDEILNGSQPALNADEVNGLLAAHSTLMNVPGYWLLLMTSEMTPELAEKALARLERAEFVSAEQADRDNLRFPLRCLLEQSLVSQKKLVDRFAGAASPVLRMEVAAHIAGKDKPRGLRLMVDILLNIGFDHETYDAISLWFAHEGDGDLKEYLLERARGAKKAADVESERMLRLAASWCGTARPA